MINYFEVASIFLTGFLKGLLFVALIKILVSDRI